MLVYITVTVDFGVTGEEAMCVGVCYCIEGKAVNAGVNYCHSGFSCHR